MRYLIFLLALAVTALGWVDEDGRYSSIPDGTLPAGGDAITLNVIDTFQVPSAGQMLGLDTQDGSNVLVVMDSEANLIRAVEMGTGDPVWTIPTPDYAYFNCCYNWTSSGWYANCCFINTNMYYYDGTWGIAFSNPAETYGRGMDFQNDGNYIWETCSEWITSTHRIYRIDETGGFIEYTITEVPGQMSGLAVFPYNSNLGIFVACYNFQEWFLYEFDGSSLTYRGSGNPGLSDFTSSYGLTYHPDTNTFFWSYENSTEQWIAEVEFTESTLEQSTWGNVKVQF
ncbi:MAG: hypothetical protein KAW14_11295 [Candidatus Aegiribacteria sp.]|nr:hypothetical protein [Candidatus Aegiribacteria sp.]